MNLLFLKKPPLKEGHLEKTAGNHVNLSNTLKGKPEVVVRIYLSK
jgi:hypothetical protein